MHAPQRTARRTVLAAALSLSAGIGISAATHAATYVYVSNAEDGDIGTYTMQNDGTLQAGDRKSTRLNSSHHRLSRMPSSA